MSDELMKLPEGWVAVNLETTVKDGRIGLVRSAKEQSTDQGFPYVRMQHYDLEGNWNSKDLTKVSASPTEAKIYELQEGDILFNTRNSYELVGKVAIWQFQKFGYLYNNNLLRLRFYKGILPKWIGYQMMAPQFRSNLEAFKSATTSVCAIYTKDLNSQTILLPPLNEQKRIVAAIESLRERSQKARSALSAIPELCDKFRQSALAAAFRGDLTADWREQNPDVEPASALLERIRLERQYRWMKETSKPAKYKEPALLDSESLPELPCNWTWANLDQLLFSLRNGLPKPPAEEKPGIPILRISAVRSREINLNDIRFYRLDKSENVDTYFLSKGDLLFTRYNGSRAFVGVCGMVQQLDGDLLYPDKLIRGQLVNQALCLPEYIELACNVGTSRKFIDSHIKTSAGQHGIAGGDIKLTPVPLPPAAEQQLIVNRIKQQFSSLQKLIFQMRSCESNFQILDRSILAEAFRGELVEQDPSDEPASALLERIRADREQQMQGKIKKPGKKKRTGD